MEQIELPKKALYSILVNAFGSITSRHLESRSASFGMIVLPHAERSADIRLRIDLRNPQSSLFKVPDFTITLLTFLISSS